jgi:hypothetical protein
VSTIDIGPRACLLTDAKDDAATTGRVWSGMAQAATEHAVTNQRFALPSGVTPSTYLATLVQMRCSVVVTVGDDLCRAFETDSPPGNAHYIAVCGRPPAGSRVTGLTTDAATATAVSKAIVDATTGNRAR